MLGHLGVNVPDLDAARACYDQVMPLLGYGTFLTAEDQFAYMPADNKRGAFVFSYRPAAAGAYSRHQTGLQHLAFTVPARSAVRRVHAEVMALGSEVIHEPGHFPQYAPDYHATFWLDPHGFMLEAVCHHDRG